MLYEFTDRYDQRWAIEMPDGGGPGVLRSPIDPRQPLMPADALGREVLRLVERVKELERTDEEQALALAGAEATIGHLKDQLDQEAEKIAKLEADCARQAELLVTGAGIFAAKAEAQEERIHDQAEKIARLRQNFEAVDAARARAQRDLDELGSQKPETPCES